MNLNTTKSFSIIWKWEKRRITIRQLEGRHMIKMFQIHTSSYWKRFYLSITPNLIRQDFSSPLFQRVYPCMRSIKVVSRVQPGLALWIKMIENRVLSLGKQSSLRMYSQTILEACHEELHSHMIPPDWNSQPNSSYVQPKHEPPNSGEWNPQTERCIPGFKWILSKVHISVPDNSTIYRSPPQVKRVWEDNRSSSPKCFRQVEPHVQILVLRLYLAEQPNSGLLAQE